MSFVLSRGGGGGGGGGNLQPNPAKALYISKGDKPTIKPN